MLCGELRGRIHHPHLDYCSTRSPYSTLLSLCNMAAVSAEEDILFLENGLLSYENPNYHLPRLDDALNSNTDVPVYDELIYKELEAAVRNSANATSNPSRRSYAPLNLGAMGVDINSGPITNLETDNRHHRNSCPLPLDNNVSGNVNRGNCRTLDLTSSIRSNQPDLIEHSTLVSDLDKIVCRDNRLASDESFDYCTKSASSSPVKSPSDDLPPGWERHQDIDGPYYWHIKSGTIQRDAPVLINGGQGPRTPLVKDAETALSTFHQTGSIGVVTRSNTSSALMEDLDVKRRDKDDKKDDVAYKRRSYPARWDNREKERAIRFAVRSLGWVDISEFDLTPERSSKAVNKCIVELSLGKNGLIDNVGRWGDGKDLFMDLDEGALKLVDPENLTVLNTQPIHTIRVWGVGRDNGRERDFAYVARDRTTRKHMCHVFRCDMPARTIANTLRDICKKIMIERSLQQSLAKPVETSNSVYTPVSLIKSPPTRPTNLPTGHRRMNRNMSTTFASFPTPMEEPKKVLVSDYLGSIEVNKASGMDVLNSAIDRLMDTTPRAQWHSVNIAVAPSMITISPVDAQEDTKPLAECRVRYLSFLGIGHDVKNCAFIMHTAQDLFVAHVFHCEPSSGALCKTIEAACKLRYQKCLDAHPQSVVSCDSKSPTKGIGATLKSLTGQLVGSFTGKKAKHS